MELRMSLPLIDLEKDIQPVSDFRANASAVLDHVRASGRPVVLTQRGRSAAVLLDIGSYQALLEENATLRDVLQGRAEIRAGEGLAHELVRQEFLTRYGG